MLRVAIFSCLAVFVLGATLPNSNDNDGRVGRIVGGQTATLGQFPYMVSLRTTANLHICGGTVTNTRWIVTAANCIMGRGPTNTVAVVGTIHRVTSGVTHRLISIISHPQFVASNFANDIAVIQTEDEISLNINVAPAILSSTYRTGGNNAIVAGFGHTSHPAGSPSDNLLWIATTTLTVADCRSRFAPINAARIQDNNICTFTRLGEGTCILDIGGGLVDGNTVIGVLSWNVPCGAGSPDVYSRISSQRSWILSHTG